MNVGRGLFRLLLVVLVTFVASVAVLGHVPICPAGTGVYDQGSGWDLLHIFPSYLVWALAAPY